MSVLEIKDFAISKINKDENVNALETVIVKNVSTVFESGRLNAIMGPNGCGKTTMLTALYGISEKTTKTSGSILLDGVERNTETWYDKVSLVEQVPYFPLGTTVESALQFSLDLRNLRMNTQDTLDKYYDVFESLYLDKLLATKIDVLSGGEKQRVSIAAEIIADKEIIILDEPTSDLDSHLALNLMRSLKKLAIERSKMIIFTIHQPSDQLVKQFDNLLFMVSGCAIYSGPLNELETYLQGHNIVKPASWTVSDFMFEVFYGESKFKVIRDQKPHIDTFLKQKFDTANSVLESLILANKSSKYIITTPSFGQIMILFRRGLKLTFKRPQFYLFFLSLLITEVLIGWYRASISRIENMNDIIKCLEHISNKLDANSVESTAFKGMIHIFKQSTIPFNDPAMQVFVKLIAYLSEKLSLGVFEAFRIITIGIISAGPLADIGNIVQEIKLTYYTPISYILMIFILEVLKLTIVAVPTVITLVLLGYTSCGTSSPTIDAIITIFGIYGIQILSVITAATMAFAISLSIHTRETIKGLIIQVTFILQAFGTNLMAYAENIGTPAVVIMNILLGLTETIQPEIHLKEYLAQSTLNPLLKDAEKFIPDSLTEESFTMFFLSNPAKNFLAIALFQIRNDIKNLTKNAGKSVLSKLLKTDDGFPLIFLCGSVLFCIVFSIITFTSTLSLRVALKA